MVEHHIVCGRSRFDSSAVHQRENGMIDLNVMSDAAEYLKTYYSEPDRKCIYILYEFAKGTNDNKTLIIIHKRYKKGWGQPTSYGYADLAVLAERYRNETHN